MHLVQLKNAKGNNNASRRVAIVREPRLHLLADCSSIYELAHAAITTGKKLSTLAEQRETKDALDYDAVYSGRSEWQLLPAIDHPDEPARCLISGTGLTHLGSARNRQTMHAVAEADLTDSMKMFQWGVEGGRPAAGSIGTSPEWFHKGTGTALRAHNEPIEVPPYALDGGEEAEIAGLYLIAPNGEPYRVGMAAGNEFSDHQLEKKNYLYLASSKLQSCGLGPELVLDAAFTSLKASVAIERDGKPLWSRSFMTGEAEMCHSLANIEHHHFKFDAHRRPGDVHVHFFGTDCLSFSEGIRLQQDDVVQVSFAGFGRPLRNPVRIAKDAQQIVRVNSL